MDEYKISLFEAEHQMKFPAHKALSAKECFDLLKKISDLYHVSTTNAVVDLSSKESIYNGESAFEKFELKKTLNILGIQPTKKIFINWYKFDKVDILNIDDVDRYFDDIWFAVADDINLFDESLRWMLSIRHYGAIGFIKL